jgi:hypothetical protein
MIQKSQIMKIVYYIYMSWKKKELKLRSAPVSVHIKVNKIITIDRNAEFISEIISTLV